MNATTVCDVALRFGSNTQVDLQLPAGEPVGKVLADAQRYLELYVAEEGCPDPLPDSSTGWRLRTPIGTLLDNDLTLDEQHVINGAPLELITAPRGEEFRPRIENVSVAVARTTEELFAAATRRALSRALAVLCAIMLSAALVFIDILAYTQRSWPHTIVALVPVAIVGALALVNARWLHRPIITDLCSLALLLFAPPALALLVPAPWNGAGPRLLVVGATAGALAVVGMFGARYLVAYTAAATVALFLVVAEAPAVTTAIPGPVTLGVLIWLLVILLTRVDLVATRLARLPIPSFPSGSNRHLGEAAGPVGSDALVPAGAPPDPALLMTRSIRANHLLTGLLIGLAVAGTAITALVVHHGPSSWPWLLQAAGIAVLFAFRPFNFTGLTNVICLLAGTFGCALAIAIVLAAHHGMWWGVTVAGIVAALALAAPLTIPSRVHSQSPLTRWLRMVTEIALAVAVMLGPVILLRVPQLVYYWSAQ